MLELDAQFLENYVTNKEVELFQDKLKAAHEKLHSPQGSGKGWMDLPVSYTKEQLSKIYQTADEIRSNSEILVVIGIGGSYLGARAAIEFLTSVNYNNFLKTKIFFVGNSMSSVDISEIIRICEDKDVSLNVVSKSGSTTECGIAFRIFKRFMEEKYGKEVAKTRIYVTTDPNKGCLRELALKEGYQIFEIPSDVGGRYSVLSPVGLLPLSVMGADIIKILQGAKDALSRFLSLNIMQNECYRYAVLRNVLHGKGKLVEILVGYETRLQYFLEWWKQLFGESEGKCKRGIFPSSAIFTSDLHSMGQFIQDGNPIFFETVITVSHDPCKIQIPYDNLNLDSLNYLSNKTVHYVNSKAFLATIRAHTSAGIPNIHIRIKETNEYELGYLIYFFQKACAISAYILGVNPFDQPGVEAYKNEMFRLLGRPGWSGV